MKLILAALLFTALTLSFLTGCSTSAPSAATTTSSTTSTVQTVASDVGNAVVTFEEQPLVDQGEGFLAGEALIKYIPSGTPASRAQIVYSIDSGLLTLDQGGTIDPTQGASIVSAFKVSSEDAAAYQSAVTEAINLANQYINSLIAAGASKTQAQAGFANFITGMQQAASLNGATAPVLTAPVPLTPSSAVAPFDLLDWRSLRFI